MFDIDHQQPRRADGQCPVQRRNTDRADAVSARSGYGDDHAWQQPGHHGGQAALYA